MLPVHVIWVLLAELTLLAGFTVGWEVSGAAPAGWAQFGLLATLAAAMGMQSSAVKDMGLTEVSTTYLTGTLTGLVSSLVSPGQDTPHGLRRFGVLIGLVAGASLCGLLVATAADGVPALPLAALITTIVAATGPGWRFPGRAAADRKRRSGAKCHTAVSACERETSAEGGTAATVAGPGHAAVRRGSAAGGRAGRARAGRGRDQPAGREPGPGQPDRHGAGVRHPRRRGEPGAGAAGRRGGA